MLCPRLTMVKGTIRSGPEDESQGHCDDEKEQEDFDQRRHVFKPGENRVWKQENDQAGHEEDGD